MSEIRSFISEADLEAARKVRQAEWEKVRKPDDPLERPEEVYENRSLYERLKEQKDKTQAEYEESHKLKNMIRGLNDDEVQFLDLVDRTKEKMETQRLQEDYYEIKSFQKAVASLADKTLEQKLEFKRTATAPLASAKGIKKSVQSLLAMAVKRKSSSDSENLSAKKLKPETAETNTKCDESANTPDTTNEVAVNYHSIEKMAINKRTQSSTISTSHLKWDRPGEPCKGKGTKPLPDPVTAKQLVLMIVLYLCRRIVFINPHVKVAVYIAFLFFGSIISDFIPLPRTYFAQKSNFLNVYFVKMGWFWTLAVVGTFVLLSSYVYNCGDKIKVRRHLSRLLIATVFWYLWTSLFVYVESVTGFCSAKPDIYLNKMTCIKNGARWYGFDISGHAFLLIYSCLIILEEVKCMRGWERIGELIRNNDFDEDSPLKHLQEDELLRLNVTYEHLGLYVKCTFIAVTLLSILWDFMLFCTILYFHSMTQKLVGGLVAIFTWFITYHFWYLHDEISPGLPGKGSFKYADTRAFECRVKSMRPASSSTTSLNRNSMD
uniref:FAM192A/Fyv6 N-terminal domain-containing protein n=1 Tax=Strigamia maritima TaxID=126957 RepID=T1J4A3_STRMM